MGIRPAAFLSGLVVAGKTNGKGQALGALGMCVNFGDQLFNGVTLPLTLEGE